MENSTLEWNAMESLIHDIIHGQKKKVLTLGQQIVPILTEDDVLQPNDFLELEHHPAFRYEEGVLAGIQMVFMALRALQREVK